MSVRDSRSVFALALSGLALACLGGCLSRQDDALDAGSPPPDADVSPGQLDGGVTPGLSDGGMLPCDVPAPTACPDSMPTFADVEPIIQARCLSCHFGQEGGPWPLTSYSHVADWHDIIRGAMLTCAMPPPDAGIAMPVAERVLILEWLRCGYPR